MQKESFSKSLYPLKETRWTGGRRGVNFPQAERQEESTKKEYLKKADADFEKERLLSEP
jgi:hypothetical protein